MSRTGTETLLHYLRRAAGPAGGLSDGELLRRWVGNRDEAAFEALAWRHGPMVLAVCRRLLPAAEAEDAFQATFLTLVRKGHTVGQGEAVGGWLYRVACRVSLAASATARQSPNGPAVEPAAAGDGPPEAAARGEARAAVLDELGRLAPRLRDAVVLCHLEGLTQEEAAQELGWPKGTVSTRLTKARAVLRSRLARRGWGPGVLAALPAMGESLPPGLVRATLGGSTSPRAAALAAAVAQRALLTPRVALAALLIVLAAGGARLGWPVRAEAPPAPPAEADPASRPKPGPRADALGDPLPPAALRRFGTARFHQEQGISAVVYFPGGKTLATAGHGGRISLWQAATGKEVARFSHEGAEVLALALSPDGRTLASGQRLPGSGGPHPPDVVLWDVATRKAVGKIACDATVACLAFSPDGRHLAGAAPGVRVWDVPSGREVLAPGDPKETALALAYSPDGGTLACSWMVRPAEFRLSLVDAATGRERLRLGEAAVRATYLAFSPDGKLLAAGGDRAIALWDAATGRAVRSLALDQPYVVALAFSPDGKTLASSERAPIRLWDVDTGKERAHLVWPGRLNDTGSAVAFSPDGKTLAVGAFDGAVLLWDAATGRRLPPPEGHELGINALGLSRDGKTVLSCAFDGTFCAHDFATGRLLRTFRRAGISAGSFSPDGSLLAAPTLRAIRLVDTATGREAGEIAVPSGSWSYFSPDGRLLAASDEDYTVHVVEVATGKEVQHFRGHPGYLRGAAFAPDGKTLATVSMYVGRGGRTDPAKTACLWDLATGEPRHWLPVSESVRVGDDLVSGVAFAPDGRTVATIKIGTLAFWDVRTGRPAGAIKHPDVWSFRYSPDGKTVATGGGVDAPIRLWETATGRERHRLRGQRSGVAVLAFTPDGRQLLSGLGDSTVLAWELDPAAGERETRPADPDRLWADLASEDAERAYRAVWRLAGMGAEGVEALSARLVPSPKASDERIRGLLGRLDDDDFAVRDAALKELEKLGGQAAPALRHVLTQRPSVEVRRRAEDLLDRLRSRPGPAGGDAIRRVRAVEALERAGTPAARGVLERLAAGEPEEPLTEEARAAVDRLNRTQVP